MKVIELKNVSKEEGHIFYMRKFMCNVVLELGQTVVETPLEFAIESSPLGMKSVSNIKITGDLNYPMLPIRRAISDFILNEDKTGHLP